jgi:group I intron endonuclease
MGIIYLIKNKINNKIYIGQTIRTFEKRWKEHCSGNENYSAISKAIKKYGIQNFETEILFECDNNELDEYEKISIEEYNSLCPNGYNIQTGGSLGKEHCIESKEKMRQSKLGVKNHNFGKPRTDKCKQNISISKSGEKHHFYGKELTLEHKLKLSKSHKDDNLPMYLIHLKERPEAYQAEGYLVSNHPKGKNKYFTSKKLTLDEKYNLAISYLNNLNSL